MAGGGGIGRGGEMSVGPMGPPTPVGERPIPGRSPFDTVNDGGIGGAVAPTFGGGMFPPIGAGPGGGLGTPLPPTEGGQTPALADAGVNMGPLPSQKAPMPPAGGMVDAGYGVGPLVNGMQQAAPPAQQPSMTPMPPVQQPSMPAGMPPQGVEKTGMAPVNGKPAQTGMSSAADAQAAMMKRAGVQTPEQMGAQRAKMMKPAPVSRVAPKPLQ